MASGSVSPLAPARFPDLPAVEGVRLATAQAGIRYTGRTDVLLVAFDAPAAVAGLFTTSRCPSAAVDWCRTHLANGARALLVNSGNANAFTGQKGRLAAAHAAASAAHALGCRPEEVFLASTGVIGEPLDAGKFDRVMPSLVARLEAGGFEAAARAIMTTDTFAKGAARSVRLDGAPVELVGIAKGSGMIAPDMATMLSYVFTDAPIAPQALQAALKQAAAGTFNAITVDGDTSTSDTLQLFATGMAARRGAPRIAAARDPRLKPFTAGLSDLLRDLALQVVRDGEGASKLIEVQVTGAVSKASARRIARSIANSPLVKTAIAGEDANWGRVVMAVGKAGEPADRDRLAIWFGDLRVAAEGARDPDYSEEAASAYMRRQEIVMRVDIGLGAGRDTVWTCDLTDGYVRINGAYRS
jgi:glutamate N-acetyltransferase/amino-acid N-acetyltransferase